MDIFNRKIVASGMTPIYITPFTPHPRILPFVLSIVIFLSAFANICFLPFGLRFPWRSCPCDFGFQIRHNLLCSAFSGYFWSWFGIRFWWRSFFTGLVLFPWPAGPLWHLRLRHARPWPRLARCDLWNYDVLGLGRLARCNHGNIWDYYVLGPLWHLRLRRARPWPAGPLWHLRLRRARPWLSGPL